MSWTRRINHPSEVVQKGEEVEAVITSVDVINQRISLSMKELLPNEWEEYANAHGVGDLVTGTVTNITDFGVFVELAPGVEGLCHISEIDRDGGLPLAETFASAQKVTCRILRIDWNENRIGLSMHSVDQDESEEVEGAATETVVADTAMAAALKAGGIVEEIAAEDDAEAETAAVTEAEVDSEDPKLDAAADEVEAEPADEPQPDVGEASAESDDAPSEEERDAENGADDSGGEEAESEPETTSQEAEPEPEVESNDVDDDEDKAKE
jgi:small subunit ribosomal protein S1